MDSMSHDKGLSAGAAGMFEAAHSRRSFLAGSVAAIAFPTLIAGALEGCGAGQPARKVKTLVVALNEGSLRTLDPSNAYEPEWFVIGRALYDQLVTFRGSNASKILPDYAATWDVSKDGLSYVFNVNPKVRFWDGSQVTPDDLVFSFTRFMNLKGPGSFLLDGVKSVEKVGPTQVKITLDGLNPDLLAILTTPSLNLSKAAAIREHGGNDGADAAKTDSARAWLDQHSVGSGPYLLDSWTHGSQLVLKRNPNYWGTPAPVETVVFKFVKDANTQRDMLLRGDAHIAINLTPDLAADLESKKQKSVAVVKAEALAPAYLGWSATKNPALANPAIWDAIKYAIDYEGLASIYRGGGQFTGSIVPPGLPGGLAASEHRKQDLNRARQALAAAGHPNGLSFKVTYGSDSTYTTVPAADVAQKLRADLQRVGITMNLDPVQFSQMLTDYRAGKLEAAVHWWAADYAGWTDFLPLFAPGGTVATKRQHWKVDASPEARQIADLTATAMKTVDPQKQYQVVQEAQRQLNQHGPFAFLFETNYQLGVRQDVIKTITPNPVWYFDITDIELT